MLKEIKQLILVINVIIINIIIIFNIISEENTIRKTK
jgi:hypothetical protein